MPDASAAAISGPGPPMAASARLKPIDPPLIRVRAGNSSTSSTTVVTLTIASKIAKPEIASTTPSTLPLLMTTKAGIANRASPAEPSTMLGLRPMRSDSSPASGHSAA